MSYEKPKRPIDEVIAKRPGVRIKLAIWQHHNDRNGRTFVTHSLKLSKSRYDADTKSWHDDDYLWPEDLPLVVAAALDAHASLAIEHRDPNELRELNPAGGGE